MIGRFQQRMEGIIEGESSASHEGLEVTSGDERARIARVVVGVISGIDGRGGIEGGDEGITEMGAGR